MTVKPLPVAVAPSMGIGEQWCSSCGYRCWVMWVTNVTDGPHAFTCRQCGERSSELIGPSTIVDVALSDCAMFVCEEACNAINAKQVRDIHSRES